MQRAGLNKVDRKPVLRTRDDVSKFALLVRGMSLPSSRATARVREAHVACEITSGRKEVAGERAKVIRRAGYCHAK